MGSYVFKRLDDMFNFFRSENWSSINTGYWAEKVEAGEVSKFDSETACNSVKQYLMNFLDDLDLSDSEDQEKSKQALEAVNDLISGAQHSGELEFWEEINSWDAEDAGGLELNDFFEAPATAKTYHYVWACYATVHAIKLYDQQIENQKVA